MSNEGWICPRCGTVHAPWVPECSCSKRKAEDVCDHQWQCIGVSTAGFIYRCSKCGEIKHGPPLWQSINTISAQ